MPLLPPVLTQGLLTLDEPKPPPDPATTALKWFDAWWNYFSGCAQLNPGTIPAAKLAAQGVFVPIMTPLIAANQVPVPVPFFMGLEGAIRAAMATVLNPAFVIPGLYLAGIPSPVPLGPLMIPTAAIGMASLSAKPPARIALASIISGWTPSNTITQIVPPPVATIVVPIF